MDAAEKKLLFLDNITISGDYTQLNPDITRLDRLFAEYNSQFRFTSPEISYSVRFMIDMLKEYSVYKDAASKNKIAVGGHIGKGKSSLFNSLYNLGILPADSQPDNAVPVYICSGNSRDSYMINSSGNYFITDDDGVSFVFKGDNSRTYGHLISSVMLSSSSFPLKKSVFLDLPGYCSSHENKVSEKTTVSYTHERLKYCNAILWAADIDIKKFTITADDIEFLKKIPESIPKIIIISKADLFPDKDLPELIEKIKKILRVNRIQYIDILSYSDKKPEKYDKFKILAYLDRWDKTSSMLSFPSAFKKIIKSAIIHDKAISEFYEAAFPLVQRINNKIYNIENVFQSENNDKFVPVETLQNEKNTRINNPLKNLDLSKIKVSELPVPNPEKLFRNYNDATVTDIYVYERYINTVSLILSEKMQNIEPVFSYSDCDNRFKNDISSIIARSFNVDMQSDNPDNQDETDKKKNDPQNDRKNSSERTTRSSRRRNQEPSGQTSSADSNDTEKRTSSSASRERHSSGLSRRRLNK